MTDHTQLSGVSTGPNPETAALLIMDVQPSVTQMVPESDAFIAELVRARAVARDAGMHVVYVRVALDEADRARVPAGNITFSAAGASGRMDDGQPATDIDPRIAPSADEIVVRKSRVGAFSTTDLADRLRPLNVDTLVLSGVATSGVVLSTLRDAADRDFRLFVLEDGCFDRDEEVHRVLMRKVFPRQASVLDIDSFVDALRPA